MRKDVAQKLDAYFSKELRNLAIEIDRNRREINKLVEKQSVLKRTKAELHQIAREFLLPKTPVE